MTSVLDKLNLRPQERRLVVAVAIVVFVVLNLWLVRPIFGEWGRTQQRIKDSNIKLNRFKDGIRRGPFFTNELRRLEAAGVFVGSEEQALRFMQEVSSQALLSGVTVQNYNPHTTGQRTNAFFEEQTLVITVQTGEKELVDFLYNLGANNSLIRVRSMTLSPDPARMKLAGGITLVESFQKKAPPRPVAAAAPPPKPTNPPPPKVTPPPAVKATNAPAGRTNLLRKPLSPPAPK